MKGRTRNGGLGYAVGLLLTLLGNTASATPVRLAQLLVTHDVIIVAPSDHADVHDERFLRGNVEVTLSARVEAPQFVGAPMASCQQTSGPVTRVMCPSSSRRWDGCGGGGACALVVPARVARDAASFVEPPLRDTRFDSMVARAPPARFSSKSCLEATAVDLA